VAFEMQVQVVNSSGSSQTLSSSTMNAGAFFDNVELIRVSDLDSEIVDGVTYARPLSSRLSSGKPLIDFSEGIHLNKTIDNVGDGAVYLRTPQYAGSAVVLDNPSFEVSAANPPVGWTVRGTPTISYDTAAQYSGNRSVRIQTTALDNGLVSTRKYLCRPGDQIFLAGRVKCNSGQADLYISYRNAAGGGNGTSEVQTASGAWTQIQVTGIVPAGTMYFEISLTSFTATADIEFDEIYCRFVSNLDSEVADGSTFRRLANVASDNTLHVSTSLNNQGSIIPNQPLNTPSFSTTTTSISLSWSSQSMKLADGTTVTVASGSKSYTGLSANTTYHLYPFVRLSDNTIQFANASPPPTSANAAAAIAANLDGCFSMNNFNVTTPASGTGGGGGGSSCPDGSELVDVQGKGNITLRDIQLGDMLRGYSFAQKADVYRKVISVRSSGAAAWRIVNGHKVSPAEPVWDGNAFTPAFKIQGATFDGSHGEKFEIHVDAGDSDEANYWLVSGTPLLTHNFLPS
jgi:hypothetical protein